MPGKDDFKSETEEPGTPTPPPPPRNAGTIEPIAWHCVPKLCWQEILFDFKIGAVIDLTPADGLLAQAALHARIPYTSLGFTRRHADELLHKLQSLVIARATCEGGTWYDPRPVESLATSKPKRKKTPKQTPLRRHMPGRRPKQRKNQGMQPSPHAREKGIQDGNI